MIYLIGGPPRVGKTTLVNYLVQKHPMHAASTDAIRYMLRRAVPREALNPDIFINFHEDVMNTWALKTPQQTLKEQNKQSKAYWKVLQKYIESYDEDGIDLILEGVAILPEFVKSLSVETRCVFLGNTSEEHLQTIKAYAKANAHDWMHAYSEHELENAAEFFQVMSTFMKDQAGMHNLLYVEMEDSDFDKKLREAAKYLLG